MAYKKKSSKYMVVSRSIKGKQYYGSWHKDKASAKKFANKLKKEHGVKVIITKKPKRRYSF